MLKDFIVSFVKAASSSVDPSTHAVLINLVGIPAFDDETESDEKGETATSPSFSAPGIIWRPRVQSGEDAAEAAAVRVGDGMTGVAWRDLRLNAVFPNPKEGDVALVGYGGGFHSFSDTAANSGDQKATIQTIYVPYEFSGGTPSKAMAVILDPTAGTESMTLVHGDGASIILKKDKEILFVIDGSTFASFKPDALTLQATKIMLKGNVYLGAKAEVGVPLLAGSASPPGPSVFISPL